jgi:hypothetical protein
VSGLSGSKQSPVDGNNGTNDTTGANVPAFPPRNSPRLSVPVSEDKIICSQNCIINIYNKYLHVSLLFLSYFSPKNIFEWQKVKVKRI